MVKMQSDRSANASPFDPDDTWDTYEERSFADQLYTNPTNMYANASAARSEAIVEAFSQSGAIQALKNNASPYSRSRGHVRLQNQQSLEERTNPNVLPYTVRPENNVGVDLVGSLNVENQMLSGNFTDRLGNTFEVWESQFPPAEKDYKSTASASSDRRLERLQGYNLTDDSRHKSEVEGIVHPGDPVNYVHDTKLRMNNMEMNNRDTYFNKNGLQEEAKVDNNREMYDGYNLKHGHASRTLPLQHSWRDQLSQPVAQRAGSNLPENRMPTAVKTKRKELTQPFHIKKANPVAVSAKSATLTLPFVSAASLRSEEVVIQPKAAHAPTNFPVVKGHVDSKAVANGRLEASMQPKAFGDSGIQGPIAMGSLDHQDLQRENHAVAPVATREWNMIKQMAQGIDHMAQDDTEIETITSNLLGDARAPDQNFDHVADKEKLALDPSALHSLSEGNVVPAAVAVSATDVKEVSVQRSDVAVDAQSLPSDIKVSATDSKTVYDVRSSYEHGPKLDAEQVITDNNRQQKAEPSLKSIEHPVAPMNGCTQLKPEKPLAKRTNAPESTTGRRVVAFPTVKTTPEEAFARQAAGHTSHAPQVHAEHTPTTEPEHATFARTNAPVAHMQEPIRTLPEAGSASGGLHVTDRIHTPHARDWRKNDKLVAQNTVLSADRSTPVRIPSRSTSTPARWTPSVQVESRREMPRT